LKLAWKKTNAGPVAMAGFPFFQLDRFLKILVQDLNKYVAISEEFPTNITGKVKSGGLLFDRRVARVVTPGTLIDEKFIDPYENNFVLAVEIGSHPPEALTKLSPDIGSHDPLSVPPSSMVGLAWLDLSTGDFFTQVTTAALLPSAIARIGAREVILDQVLPHTLKQGIQALVGEDHHLLTFHECGSEFRSMSEWIDMLEAPVGAHAEDTFSEVEKVAGHRLLDYVRNRLQGLELKLQPPHRKRLDDSLTIDRSSLRGLEVLQTARDALGKGSLLHAVRRTTTKSGARLLRDRLTAPSASLPEINTRLDLVQTFLDDAQLREDVVQLLGRSYDVQRLVQKFSLNKGDADDMICLARAIDASQNIRTILRLKFGDENESCEGEKLAVSWLLNRLDLEGPTQLAQRISMAIDEEALSQKHRLEEDEAATVAALAQEVIASTALPDEIESMPKKLRSQPKSGDPKDQDQEAEDPWIMCRTASDTLGRLHNDLDLLKQEKSELASSLRNRLQAPSLTLRWTPGLGHICHVKGAIRVLLETVHARIVQSTKSTRSFYVTEWSRLGSKIDQAKLYIQNEEQRIFTKLRYQVIKNLVKLRRNAAVVDELDIACSFATLAQEQSLVRPIMNTGLTHKIVGGRHATVTLGLEEQGRSFVSNDLFLGQQQRVWLVTGPNMGGKSTFLRQNALITILAQVGSYVPAKHAEIGIVDQIFSRIGAADDLFRDQSTFMVEMLETAAILKQATSRSFVIMDEVGRGTTPEDGTAIGYACLHHLYHINKCRTLFATHFHALADMTQGFEELGRYCTDVLEDDAGSFSFMHRIRQGVNRQSHALKVARLAGLPEPAIIVARDVLKRLDKQSNVQLQQNDTVYEQPLLSAAAG
jgi:DNA mismatch repair ATPase MutS